MAMSGTGILKLHSIVRNSIRNLKNGFGHIGAINASSAVNLRTELSLVSITSIMIRKCVAMDLPATWFHYVGNVIQKQIIIGKSGRITLPISFIPRMKVASVSLQKKR